VSWDDERKTEEAVRAIAQQAEEPMEVDLHDDRTKAFSRSALARMVTRGPDPELRRVLEDLESLADREILKLFGNAYQVMNDLYGIVRVPRVDRDGVVQTDQYGFPLWEVNESGYPVEEWYRMGHKERQDFLLRITTNLFSWEQEAATLRGNSQYAKAVWEAAVAKGYEDSRLGTGKTTIEDRIQAARLASRDERLEGIFYTVLSHRADALVRSISLIGQRLKDILSA
jgi:hypothetical protein